MNTLPQANLHEIYVLKTAECVRIYRTFCLCRYSVRIFFVAICKASFSWRIFFQIFQADVSCICVTQMCHASFHSRLSSEMWLMIFYVIVLITFSISLSIQILLVDTPRRLSKQMFHPDFLCGFLWQIPTSRFSLQAFSAYSPPRSSMKIVMTDFIADVHHVVRNLYM